MAQRRYEFRVTGRLSDLARSAFDEFTVIDGQGDSIIYGDVHSPEDVHGVLARILSMGLHVVSSPQISAPLTDDPAR